MPMPMPIQSPQFQRLRSSLRSLGSLISPDFINTLSGFWQLGKHIRPQKMHEGMYEVLEYESRLELKDIEGKKAVFYKRQRVHFLQDHIIAFQDKAWGDGEIFADYKCSPGAAVDRYREGHRYRVLISLRETKNRGDIEEFHIERTVTNGFTKKVEAFQTEIDHITRKLSVSIVFPRKRLPKQITLIEQNATRSTSLGPQHTRKLPDGRQQITWSTMKPELFEAYILRWEW